MSFIQDLPRIIHQIWLGAAPLPKYATAFSTSWREKHPGWDYKLWTDADVSKFEMCNQREFDDSDNLGMKSDVFRYEILLRHGGIYADIDIQCLKNFQPLLAAVRNETLLGFEPAGLQQRSICNALIGSLPHAAFMTEVVKQLPESYRVVGLHRKMHETEFTSRATGPAFLSRVAHMFGDVTVFPSEVFYPPSPIHPAAFTFHLFSGTWRSRGD